MLVLTRKLGQRLKFGNDIYVTVVRIDKHTVRIGVEAPKDLVIQREELDLESVGGRSSRSRDHSLALMQIPA